MQRTATVCACGDHGFVALTRGHVAFIDPEFVPAVALWSWNAHRDRGGHLYARRTQNLGDSRRASIPLHRMVMPLPDGMLVDHVDGDTLNDRRKNLRPATTAQNANNQKKRTGTTSRFRGVSRSGSYWRAVIGFGGRQKYLGTFATEEEAARAYDQASAEIHGDTGRQNFGADLALVGRTA